MGEIENRPHDPSQMRISDADRQRVADVLRDAAGDGRIDLDELEERLELTWQAKTYGELVPITLDLQAPGPAAPPAGPPVRRTPSAVPAVGHNSSVAIMSECKRHGVWSVPEHHSACAIMGEVKVIVPADMHVVMDGTPIMGEFSQAKDKVPAEVGPGSPVVRIRGMALMGSVTVQRQPAPGTPKKYLGTY